ncbi:MAG: hypothetical protein AB1806_09360 [Acidobacteriota bacterium]
MSASNSRRRSPGRALNELAAQKASYGGDSARSKLLLLRMLQRSALARPGQVVLLHEILVFLHAYPDDQYVYAQVRRMLEAFGRRADLRRHRKSLESSGIAGTDTVYPFAASTARWLAGRTGPSLTVEWNSGENTGALETRLPSLTLWAERSVFDEPPLEHRAWLDRLRGSETDASFLVRRSAARTGTDLLGDQLYDELNLTLRIAAGPRAPDRTRARFSGRPLVLQRGLLRTGRPDLRVDMRVPPRGIRPVSGPRAVELIDLSREAMVTRARDLYCFAAADPADVRIADCGDGLEFACMGVRVEQRLLLDAVYGFLTLRNGVPIGYALFGTLWHSAEVAYNVFETFRGAEAAWIYGRLLATVHAMFGVDTITVDPYQLGHHNDEGLESGAWWFYYKLGFRPRDPAVSALARREAERVRRRPGHRTGLPTLRGLVAANVFFSLGADRDDVMGSIETDAIALGVSDMVARRFGSDREGATVALADEAASALGVPDWRRLRGGPRLFWERWAPLVALLPVGNWTEAERFALRDIIIAKGGRRESDYVTLFDAHPRLGAALASLARGPGGSGARQYCDLARRRLASRRAVRR